MTSPTTVRSMDDREAPSPCPPDVADDRRPRTPSPPEGEDAPRPRTPSPPDGEDAPRSRTPSPVDGEDAQGEDPRPPADGIGARPSSTARTEVPADVAATAEGTGGAQVDGARTSAGPLPALSDGGLLPPAGALAEEILSTVTEFRRLMMIYRFGIDEVMTKINILRGEFRQIHAYNPIENTCARIKSFESILGKARRKGIELTAQAVRAEMRDIAGVRVTCSFVSDIYRVRDALVSQRDLVLLEERDYIREPKPNGYKSLHLIVQVPVFLSDREEDVVVEIQLRTIAMDFWASLEHKIYYKYDADVPAHLTHTLKLAADVAAMLDRTMENLHEEIRGADAASAPGTAETSQQMADAFLRAMSDGPWLYPER